VKYCLEAEDVEQSTACFVNFIAQVFTAGYRIANNNLQMRDRRPANPDGLSLGPLFCVSKRSKSPEARSDALPP
jgi:hypothetical protein